MNDIEKSIRDLMESIRHAKYEMARPVHDYEGARHKKLWQARHDGWVDDLRRLCA